MRPRYEARSAEPLHSDYEGNVSIPPLFSADGETYVQVTYGLGSRE